jgi:lysophospholipase L1-like esterase
VISSAPHNAVAASSSIDNFMMGITITRMILKCMMTAAFAVSLTFAQAQAPAADAPVDAAKLKTDLDRANRTLQDWPNLKRYHDANATVAAPAPGEERVVFMGDSITDGWGKKYGQFFPGKPYINRGISGQTTPQMLIRFRPDVIALQPKVVVILAGTNDIAGNTGPMSVDEITGNLASMAELARAHGVRVVLASVLPVHNYTPQSALTYPLRSPDQIRAINRWLQGYCAANGHVYLDYFSAMIDDQGALRRELAEDGLHPGPAGYAIMARLADAAIARALAPPAAAK